MEFAVYVWLLNIQLTGQQLAHSVMDIIAQLAIISLELLALLVLRIMASVLERVLCVLVDFTLLEE